MAGMDAEEAAVLTIGYEGVPLDNYLDKLRVARVALVCDVRRNAWSRKIGFAKRPLSQALAAAGIAYEHLPALGCESARRKAVRTAADLAALFSDYRAELPEKAAELARLHQLLRAERRVALACFEADPQSCHRHIVAEWLSHHHGYPVQHL